MAIFLLLLLPTISLGLSSVAVRRNYYSVKGGWTPKETEYTWVVGVHKRTNDMMYHHICGGSIISTSMILSAAHCFRYVEEEVTLDNYRLTVGNFHRPYDLAPMSCRKKIKELIFYERYRGSELNYAHDIVIVLLYHELTLNDKIAPIAIDWSYKFKDKQLLGRSGVVVGWGYTDTGEPSFTRYAAKLPFVDFKTCWKSVPRAFRQHITPDKFCAGLRNGTTVCPGDSGNGLAFFNAEDKKWYLRGVVSIGVVDRDKMGCSEGHFSVFTSITFYHSWLMDEISTFNEVEL